MSNDSASAALETLLLPFASGDLGWPGAGAVRFLGAREGWPLRQFPLQHLVCEQTFKPLADELVRAGLTASAADDAATDVQAPDALVLALLPRQREQARALLAYAVARATPGGRVLACVPNNEGAKAAQADLARLAGAVDARTKNHCRVFWTPPLTAIHDAPLLDAWRALDAPRPILDGNTVSRPGVFAWDRIDAASALLAEHLPDDLAGHGADLGAGWGYLAREVLRRNPRVAALDLFEADIRALTLAQVNLAPHVATTALAFHWHDVCAGLPRRYDFIVSNPPFHAATRDARPDIGRGFIATAAAALQPGGRLWLVANRHLPYEQTLAAGFARVTTHAQRDGFKIIEAVKDAAKPA